MSDKILYHFYSVRVHYFKKWSEEYIDLFGIFTIIRGRWLRNFLNYFSNWWPHDSAHFDLILTDKAGYILNKDTTQILADTINGFMVFGGKWISKKIMHDQIQKNERLMFMPLEERLLNDMDTHKFLYSEVRKLRLVRFFFSHPHRLKIYTSNEKFSILLPKEHIQNVFRFLQDHSSGSFIR